MKNKRVKNTDYSKLKRKTFLQIFFMIVVSFSIILTVYTLYLHGKLAEWIVWCFQNIFRVDYETALNIYQRVIRNNLNIIIFFTISILFLVMFYFFLNWFTKYFNEINRGIDELISESGQDISLMPELTAVEEKLNFVRQTLEKRQTEAALADQRKNDLVVYLAHDLKTPLTSVIGYLSLLRDESQISEELRQKYLSITLDKAERLEDLINEFFEITRFSLSNAMLELSNVNLSRMLEQIMYEFKPMLSDKNLKYVLNVAPNIKMIKCDVNKMQRVFDNLLRNAVNYSFNDSTIEVSVSQTDTQTNLNFTNHGNTIPAEKLNRIFEQFFRLDTARTTKNGGAGLGLAVAKEIIELHSGKISAHSENELITFELTIPVL